MTPESMTIRESCERLAAYIEYLDVSNEKQPAQSKDLIIMLLKRKAGMVS